LSEGKKGEDAESGNLILSEKKNILIRGLLTTVGIPGKPSRRDQDQINPNEKRENPKKKG